MSENKTAVKEPSNVGNTVFSQITFEETELLRYFRFLPQKEQWRLLGRLELMAGSYAMGFKAKE